ncbi:MAG: sugar phosphate isomerase/epimerase [Chloroflexia bacterium]|nr:sugar phosphate isomerase/epimerase [Chloroflexia bacterium]
MFTALIPHAIGIKGRDLAGNIALAADAGFDGVTFDITEAAALADAHGIDHVRALFTARDIQLASWGVPVAWRDDEQRDAQLKNLPKLAALAVELGCPRATSGIMPGSDERPYDEQFVWTVERLQPLAETLRAAGAQLGLEFIGPKTFRARWQHEFIYTLRGTFELAEAVGTGNVGVLLDAWHLYTSGGTIDEIDALQPGDVVLVHVNDAPAGIPVDEQVDNVRALPMETGVIDVPEMLRRLDAIGYEGPVAPEPFSRRVEERAATDPEGAARETADSMRQLWDAAGLAG